MISLKINKSGIIRYLNSDNSFASRKRSVASLSILLAWLSVVIFVSAHHIVWRDEVRALTIALQPESIFQLPSLLRNEGHPVLWYVILRLGFLVIHSTAILKISSVSISFAAVFLFFRFAPFAGWQKIIFICGLPIYEYSIMARNYGISMLLLFMFAKAYEQKEEKPLWLAGILFLLSNTNAHSTVLAGILLIMWSFDNIIDRRHQLSSSSMPINCGAYLVVLAGIGFALVTSLPDHDNIVTKAFTASQVVDAVLTNVVHPAGNFNRVMFKMPTMMGDVLLWILIAGLWAQKHIAAALYAGMVLLGTLFTIVYPGHLRHQGLFLIFVITLYWIFKNKRLQPAEGKPASTTSTFFSVSLYLIIPILLITQMAFSAYKIRRDVTKEQSSSCDLSKFIESRQEYHEAIILGEPDYCLESLPYYISNPIYIPREGQFRKYTLFTKANRKTLSMGELLNIANAVKNSYQKPVLIAFGLFKLSNSTSTLEKITFGCRKEFTWSDQELSKFKESTVKLAEFNAATTDENYEVFALR